MLDVWQSPKQKETNNISKIQSLSRILFPYVFLSFLFFMVIWWCFMLMRVASVIENLCCAYFSMWSGGCQLLLSLTHFSPSASQQKVTLFINFLLGRPGVKEIAKILWNFDFHALGWLISLVLLTQRGLWSDMIWVISGRTNNKQQASAEVWKDFLLMAFPARNGYWRRAIPFFKFYPLEN